MKLKEVLDKSIQFFKDKQIESPRLSAELLISSALKMERMQLYLKYESPLTDQEVSKCRVYIKRHILGESVAYITQVKGFFGEDFIVGPGVLVPRPETEGIVEEALAWIENNPTTNLNILDLGSGSGCIGLSLLKQCLKSKKRNFQKIHLICVERSTKAFQYLEKNTQQLALDQYVELINQDALEFLKTEIFFDIIVANPPYIDKADSKIDKHVKAFEPHEALFAEDQGTDCLKNWSLQSFARLKNPGILLMEMGCDQGSIMQTFLGSKKIFGKIEIIKDLSGLDRIIKATT